MAEFDYISIRRGQDYRRVKFYKRSALSFEVSPSSYSTRIINYAGSCPHSVAEFSWFHVQSMADYCLNYSVAIFN